MTIAAKVIAHSRGECAPDLVTLQMRYPRFIHAEFMTHRVFSRNASSSRAIPIQRMIQDVLDDPAMPEEWHYNEPGMQGRTSMSPEDKAQAIELWLTARDEAVDAARQMLNFRPHKQIVNRLLEPFGHISVVVTATDWENFFDLRCHPDADPTMRALGEATREAIAGSEPKHLNPGWWHFPYVSESEWDSVRDTVRPEHGGFAPDGFVMDRLAMISAARCARVSYLNHDGTNPDIDKDLALAERLLESKHMSPFEHQARLTGEDGTALWGNLTGWNQHRKMIELQ